MVSLQGAKNYQNPINTREDTLDRKFPEMFTLLVPKLAAGFRNIFGSLTDQLQSDRSQISEGVVSRYLEGLLTFSNCLNKGS